MPSSERLRSSRGLSNGTGLTNALDIFESDDGTLYYDTPGLDDIVVKGMAAKNISKAFMSGGRIKLIFVITLEAECVRPSDVAAIDVVLNAVSNSGIVINGKFTLIVNQLPTEVMHILQEEHYRA